MHFVLAVPCYAGVGTSIGTGVRVKVCGIVGHVTLGHVTSGGHVYELYS